MFFGGQDIGVVFWSNGTRSPLRKIVTNCDKNKENAILTELGTIPAIYEKIVYMARN